MPDEKVAARFDGSQVLSPNAQARGTGQVRETMPGVCRNGASC